MIVKPKFLQAKQINCMILCILLTLRILLGIYRLPIEIIDFLKV